MSTSIPAEQLFQMVRTLFTEAYEGERDEGGTWFVNNARDAGVFGVIDALSAETASSTLGNGGRTIAAHVEHLRWSLANVNGVMRGEPWQPDWSASWTVQEVDDSQWNELRATLRGEFEALSQALAKPIEISDPMMLLGAMALAPHAAHHLGTIRLMARLLQR